jgi:hypothetical protein
VMHASRQGLSLRNSTPASVVFEALLRGLGIFCVGLLDWRGSASSSSSSRSQHQECGSSTRAAAAGGGQQQHPSHTQLRSFMPGTVAVRACVFWGGGGCQHQACQDNGRQGTSEAVGYSVSYACHFQGPVHSGDPNVAAPMWLGHSHFSVGITATYHGSVTSCSTEVGLS